MNNVVITQLEKALKSKDDKELRLRIEVLLDVLKEETPRPTYIPQVPPQPTYYDTNQKVPQPTVSNKIPKINGAGSITSANSEQINYTRPKGT